MPDGTVGLVILDAPSRRGAPHLEYHTSRTRGAVCQRHLTSKRTICQAWIGERTLCPLGHPGFHLRVPTCGVEVIFFVQVSGLFRDGAGRIIGASRIARDITGRKRAEQEMQRADRLAW
jgi:hypothetical protein